MPHLNQLNLLFIHIPKNAGRTIEQAMFRNICTPDSGRRNMMSRLATLIQRKSASKISSQYLIGTLDVALASQHLSLGDIISLGLLPRDVLISATIFSVCRNPYSRVLSSLAHFEKLLIAIDSGVSLKDTIGIERALEVWRELPLSDHNLVAHRRPQHEFLASPNKKVEVGDVLRFERLEDDFIKFQVKHQMHLSPLGWMGKSNVPTSSYRGRLNSNSKKLVERMYDDDLDFFKYSW